MEEKENTYPRYFGEFYAANTDKFEKKKNNLMPKLYYAVALIAIILVIFPAILPMPSWLTRTIGVIVAIVAAYKGYMSSFDIINLRSGGKVKELGLKKFKRDETDINRILDAFLKKDFEYLSNLPGAYSAPVQLHIEEDAVGRELYCMLTTYKSDSEIVGLADVLTLSGSDYDKYESEIKRMCKEEENN